MSVMTSWLISTLTGGAVFLAMAAFAPARGWRVPSVTTPVGVERVPRPSMAVLARWGRSPLAARIGRSDLTRRRLDLAGRPFDVAVLRGAQLLASLGGGSLFAILGMAWRPGLVLVPLACLIGVRLPEMVLARRSRRRQAQIAARVPDLVEILLAVVDAGLAPAAALARVSDVIGEPLRDEVRRVVREVELGVPWQLALEHLVDRTDVPSLRAVAVALTRSQRLGTAMGVTLRRVVEDLRRDRRLRAEEVARKAPLKMLFPLVFLILPAFLLLTVGPVVLATIRSLH
jgi:tight adherence protein C